jgi:hypothetical protein
VTDPEVLGRQAEQSDWLDQAVRVACLYAALGVTAVRVAVGSGSWGQGSSGIRPG